MMLQGQARLRHGFLRGVPSFLLVQVVSNSWASPERPTPQPRVLPERRRMDGRPPRTGSRCAPVCRVRGRPEGA